MSKYDKGALERFINDTINRRGATEADSRAAAFALRDVLVKDIDLQKQLEMRRKPGQRGPKIPRHVGIDDSRFGVVVALVSGRIQYKKALDELIRITGMEKDAVEDFIRDVRPRAKRHYDNLLTWFPEATEGKAP